MSRRASAPTPLPRSRLDEVLRAGIGEWSTPRALQPASVDVAAYPSLTGREANNSYMQSMVWAQYPRPDPDTPMARGVTLYDPPNGFAPVNLDQSDWRRALRAAVWDRLAITEGARQQWEDQLANWLVWADSSPYEGGAKAALLQFKSTLTAVKRAFEHLKDDNEETRLLGARDFLNAMFARVYHMHHADEFVLQISSIPAVGGPRANNSPRVAWGVVMRSAWTYYRALGVADEVVGAAQRQALALWPRPPPDEAP